VAPLAEGNYLSSVVHGCVLPDTCTGLARIAPIRHRRLRPPSLWRGKFEAAPRWRRGRGRGRNLSRRERLQNAQLLESKFLTCSSRLVPLRFVIVFPCGLNFSTGPWVMIPENLPTGRCLRTTDYVIIVMLSSDLCSRKCHHAPLDRLCGDDL